MSISEFPIDEKVMSSIAPAAKEGAGLLGIGLEELPERIVAAIDAFVANPPPSRLEKSDNWTDRALPLGSLWGEQMVRVFRWEWSSVAFHDRGDTKAVGVFSGDRSLAIYPFHFLFGCLENGAPATVQLAFNMLASGKVPAFRRLEFKNLMDHIAHVVPR